MAKQTQSEKYSVGLAGEFYVAAELHRHQVHGAVSYGNAKNADVFAFLPDKIRFVKVEVKSTWKGSKRWLVGHIAGKDESVSPDVFWVLVLIPRPLETSDETGKQGDSAPEFYVLTSKELVEAVQTESKVYLAKYRAKWGKDFDEAKGVPQISVGAIQRLTKPGAWAKITGRLAGPR